MSDHDWDVDTGIWWCGVRRVQWVAGSAPKVCPCCETPTVFEYEADKEAK